MDIKNFEKDIEKVPIQYEAGRASYLWVANVLYNYLAKEGSWSLDLPGVVVFKNTSFKLYLSFIPKIINSAFERLSKPGGMKSLEKEIKTLSTKIQNICINESDPSKSLSKSFASCFDLFEYMHHTATYLRKIDKAIINKITDKFGSESVNILSACNVSNRLSFFAEEEIALCDLVLKIKNNPKKDLSLELNKIFNSYKHITLGYYDEQPRTYGYYKKRLDALKKEKPEIIKKKIISEHKSRLKELNGYLKKYSGDQVILKLIGETSWMKDCYKFYINKAQFEFEKLWKIASKQIGLPVGQLKNLMHEDLINLLKGKKLSKDKLNLYKKTIVFVAKPKGYKFYISGDKAEDFINKYIEPKADANKEIKGRSACKGKAKGRVKIVLLPEQFKKVEKGDILVVHNTSPDFVPILHKVSAVLAEEGGITAHVSVITRELNIPSIVGIPRITSILKDGDLVEVDADKGIVKLIQ